MRQRVRGVCARVLSDARHREMRPSKSCVDDSKALTNSNADRYPVVRRARAADIPFICTLQRSWTLGHGATATSDGFLSAELYTPHQLERCIAAGGIAVAEFEGVGVGYYMLDSDSGHPRTQHYKDVVAGMQAAGELPPGPLCARAQAALDRTFHGRGLSKALLLEAARGIAPRFDGHSRSYAKTT